MKLKFFTTPKGNYSDYTFWRSDHQRKAVFVILGAAAFALGEYLCS